MKKDAYYFPHDSNAKDDPKCVILIEQLGLEGYGIFWVLIETLRDQPTYKYPLDSLRGLARRYNTSFEKMEIVVKGFNLFEIDENNFFSLSLYERMKKIDSISVKRSRAVKERWKKEKQCKLLNTNDLQGDTNVLQKQFNCNTNVIQEKKIKEKKIKENEKEKSSENFEFLQLENYKPFETAFQIWIDYKGKKAYKNENSLKIALNHLIELSSNNPETALKIVNQSIANNWKGLFELKGSMLKTPPNITIGTRQRDYSKTTWD